MAEVLYHKEGLFGANLELHIAQEGLTLVGRAGTGSAEFAPLGDVTGITVTKTGRKSMLGINFGSTRPGWVINGLSDSVAEWAQALIDSERSTVDKRTLPAYSTRMPIGQLSTSCSEIVASGDGRAAVDLADFLLAQAVLHEASDAHFDPFSDGLAVKFRVNGVLQDVASIDSKMQHQLVSRLKVVSRLATYRNAVAQEGRAALKIGGRTVDFRCSCIPTIHGEKFSARIFDPQKSIFEIDKLGMPADMLGMFQKTLMQPQGTIILTGPAGSGKTTTMYAALSYLKANKKNLSSIATVEDPVEYDLQVVNQTQVNNASGLTFANALRTVLRQDPEVIMIGEIRDRETADIATQAGLTGHMVLSTVHARSAAGVLLRLVDLGVEPFLVASSVTGILSQRLVRTRCPECQNGCQNCAGTGYAGRTGIFQLVPVSDSMRELVLRNASLAELEAQIEREQIPSLQSDGEDKVKAGTTTTDELERVLG